MYFVPECYLFLQETWASRTSETRESRCGHPWSKTTNPCAWRHQRTVTVSEHFLQRSKSKSYWGAHPIVWLLLSRQGRQGIAVNESVSSPTVRVNWLAKRRHRRSPVQTRNSSSVRASSPWRRRANISLRRERRAQTLIILVWYSPAGVMCRWPRLCCTA